MPNKTTDTIMVTKNDITVTKNDVTEDKGRFSIPKNKKAINMIIWYLSGVFSRFI